MKGLMEKVFGAHNGRALEIADAGDCVEECIEDSLENFPECQVVKARPCVKAELSERVERLVEQKQLYLDPSMSLTKLALACGSNRTYVSAVMAEKQGFRRYINEYRLAYFYGLLNKWKSTHTVRVSEDSLLEEPEERLSRRDLYTMVIESGFADMRTFQNALGVSSSDCAQKIRQEVFLPRRSAANQLQSRS